MKLEEYFQKEDLERIKDSFTIFHEKTFLDDYIKNPDALLLVIYMISNKNMKSEVNSNDCLELFCKIGRKEEEFRKALYEITTRKERNKEKSFLDIRGKGKNAILSLNFFGIKKIKEILNMREK